MLGLGGGTRGETRGTVAFEKAPQNFYERDGWISFVQFGLITNLVPSNAFGQVQMLQEIVLGRLRGRIRRLFDVGAIIRVENDGGFYQCTTYNQ